VTLAFRTAREEDLDRLVEIHTSAYPDTRGPEARRRNFAHNPLGGLDRLWVAEREGALVGHAFLFALEAWFGGVLVPTAGIASVGVAPEARRRGVAHSLMAHLHACAQERGDALVLLHPFRQSFYAGLGYSPVTPSKRLAMSPKAVPAAWHGSVEADVLRPAAGDDRAAIERLYEEAGARRTGWLVRGPRAWERRLSDERRVWCVLERQGALAGYVVWTLVQDEVHAPTTLVVDELVAADDAAKRRLVGLLGAQRDQVAEIQLDVDASDPLDRALTDADGARWGTEKLEHCLGALVGGPMVRLVEPRRAIEARGYRAEGTLELRIDGAPPLSLDAREGRGRAVPPRGGPCVHASAPALGAVLYGGLAPSEAARLGWLQVDDEATLRRADELLAIPPFFSFDTF